MEKFFQTVIQEAVPKNLRELVRERRRMSGQRALRRKLAAADKQGLLTSSDLRAALREHELKVYSQNGEDGVLLYLFHRFGAVHKTFVEFGVGTGRECNTANLAFSDGWRGLWIDRDAHAARDVARNQRAIRDGMLKIEQNFVTAENINGLLTGHGVSGEIDLLSIDIDGNDYWVWKAVTAVAPRIVVIEYNASLGPRESLAVVYDPDFDRHRKHPSGWYHGASLAGLTALACEKGYVLAGCESKGVNAFYVRKDVALGKMEEAGVQRAFYPHYERMLKADLSAQFEIIKHLEFVRV